MGSLCWRELSSTATSFCMSTESLFDRRQFFSWVRNGLGSAALASLLLRDRMVWAGLVPGEARDRCPHFAAKAQRAIHICLCGAMSQVDSFDYKPDLIRQHGRSLASAEPPDVFCGRV